MKDDAGERFTFEKGLRELGARLREEYGITSLKPGEIRPPEYYMIDHYWGLPMRRVRRPKNEKKS